MEKYRRQETVTIQVEHRLRASNALTDADTADAEIWGPHKQLVVDTQDMTKTATGTYQYYYTSAAGVEPGVYWCDCVLVTGTHYARPRIYFEIVKEVT